MFDGNYAPREFFLLVTFSFYPSRAVKSEETLLFKLKCPWPESLLAPLELFCI